MSFKVGDTVQLKSGGPGMTVTRIGTAAGEPMVWCAWFEGTKDLYGLFPPEALKAPSERPEQQPQAALEPQTAPSEPLPVDNTPPEPPLTPEPHPTPEPEPIEADSALAFGKMKSLTWAFSKPTPLPTEVDRAPVTPEAGEAKQDPHPTKADSAPGAEKNGKPLEDQIASMQSLLANWLKQR